MPVVLVIIIVAAWVVILGPNLVKRRARTGGDQSITHFHNQLRILEQRAPDPIVTPAYRLRSVDGVGAPTGIQYPDSGRPPVLTVVGAKELPRPALAFLGESEVAAPVAEYPVEPDPLDRPGRVQDFIPAGHRVDHLVDHDPDFRDALVPAVPAPRAVDSYVRAQARRRRRDTLAVLGVVFVVTLLAGAVTGSVVAWAVVGVDAVALAAYVGLLVHLRRLAEERESKLRYLDVRSGQLAKSGGLPTQVSGRYAHPSSQQVVAR